MGVTKSEIFTEKQNELAKIAKVLGHPARIAILEHLLSLNACVCGDLVDVIGLAQATISQHLKELKNIGLIQGTVEGTRVCYCINQENWQKYAKAFEYFFDTNNSCTDNECC
ncbi:MAG: metalloregulator ArsR/SmtB family transcription factor [Flavobacteriales bacterium]|jgi:DNA-binding transcriptional ArsR family regulator|nr:metalloregulator ArsR/SmtB family transcription factor [Flavobacteriales bacterium]